MVQNARWRQTKMRFNVTTLAAVCILSLGVPRTSACTWSMAYFNQVTLLKGTVVGSNFPLLHSFRWFRHSVVRPAAKLTLYEYCWPCDVRSLTPVKTVFTDADGKFDFGILKPSHYFLRIDDEKGALSDFFEVEVKGQPNPEESQVIDISHFSPSCSGGHEFIVKTK